MNRIILSGYLSEIERSHEIDGQKFGKATLLVAKENNE